jgi:hypothetical protein
MGLTMVIWEGRVPEDQWASLETAYSQVTALPPAQMIEHFLTHDTEDPVVWRMISLWRSSAALEEYRSSVDTPGGLMVFRAAGVEPTRSESLVYTNATRS